MTLKIYDSAVKGLKLKVRQFCGITITFDTFREVTGENLLGGGRLPLCILKRAKNLGGSGIILLWYKKMVQVRKEQGMYTSPTPWILHRLSCYLQNIAVQTQLLYVRACKTANSSLDQYQNSILISTLPISFLSNAIF